MAVNCVAGVVVVMKAVAATVEWLVRLALFMTWLTLAIKYKIGEWTGHRPTGAGHAK